MKQLLFALILFVSVAGCKNPPKPDQQDPQGPAPDSDSMAQVDAMLKARAAARAATMAVPGKTYYVANAGNDANSGLTQAAPWKTMVKVRGAALLPGDTVKLKRGDMWREYLLLEKSGTDIQPIVYGAYGTGAKPIINGANVRTGWKSIGNNIWSMASASSVQNKIMVIVDGKIYEEVYSMAALTDSTYYIKTATTPDSVFIYKPTDPNLSVTEMSRVDQGIFTITAIKYVTIQDLEVRYVGGHGIELRGSGTPTPCYVTIKNCHVYANRTNGIMATNRFANVTVDSCTASFNGNGIYDWGGGNMTVRNSHTWDNIHYPNAHFTDGGGIQNYQGDNWLVENCTSDRDNDAIHIDAGGVATNAIIRYCRVSNSKKGRPANPGPSSPSTPGMGVGSVAAPARVQFYYNELVNNAEAGFTSWTLSNGTVEFYNNTIYSNDQTGTVWGIYCRYGVNFVFKNNLIVKTIQNGGPLYQQDNVSAPAIMNFNGYFQQAPIAPRWLSLGVNYTTFAAWKNGSGQDANSVYADPLFVSRDSVWRLQATSPMVDAGTNLGLPARDINGLPIIGVPDIGAHEFQSVIVPPIPPQPVLTFDEWTKKYYPGTYNDLRTRYDSSNKQ